MQDHLGSAAAGAAVVSLLGTVALALLLGRIRAKTEQIGTTRQYVVVTTTMCLVTTTALSGALALLVLIGDIGPLRYVIAATLGVATFAGLGSVAAVLADRAELARRRAHRGKPAGTHRTAHGRHRATPHAEQSAPNRSTTASTADEPAEPHPPVDDETQLRDRVHAGWVYQDSAGVFYLGTSCTEGAETGDVLIRLPDFAVVSGDDVRYPLTPTGPSEVVVEAHTAPTLE